MACVSVESTDPLDALLELATPAEPSEPGQAQQPSEPEPLCSIAASLGSATWPIDPALVDDVMRESRRG